MRSAGFILITCCLCAAPAAATPVREGAGPPPDAVIEALPTGRVIDRVHCAADPDRSYALYLPSRYDADSRWPVLILMDPRGRALVPMDLFREAAERLGYVVVSSYDTRSDTPRPVNRDAMGALLPDIEARLSLDPRRYYLAGFSGTARAAWGFGSVLGGRVAGVIGVGAGYPPGYQMLERMPFSFFGAAGRGDFNYDEMWALDEALDRYGTPHRIEYFDGAHQWPDASICARAVEWMELQAMHGGLRQSDETLTDSLYAARMSEADRLSEAGRDYDAWILLGAMVEDFSGLLDVDAARTRVDELGRRESVLAARARHAEIAVEHDVYQNRLMSYLAGLHRPSRPPPLSRSLRALRIRDLRDRTAAADDPIGAGAAARWLEHVYVLTAIYVPQDRLDENEPEFSLAALQIASAIKEEDARICLGEARAYAQLGKKRKALRKLECAMKSGRLDPERLGADPYLEPLRDEDAYRQLLGRGSGPS